MAQTKAGAIKVAANRIGVSPQEYQRKLDDGLKYCYACKEWHPQSQFCTDLSRGDGLASRCKQARSGERAGYKQKETRDQIRAHRMISMRVRRGKLPHPDSVPCMDCDHMGTDRRHEYDHYLGYGPDKNDKVQAVCSLCHAQRHKERRRNGTGN